MEAYKHTVQYYETDKMGITHHSNYIRWMEEARVDYLDKIGYGYKRLEDEGIISPVIGVECEYKSPTTFDDTVAITVDVEEFKGVKLILKYTMVNAADGKTVADGAFSPVPVCCSGSGMCQHGQDSGDMHKHRHPFPAEGRRLLHMDNQSDMGGEKYIESGVL